MQWDKREQSDLNIDWFIDLLIFIRQERLAMKSSVKMKTADASVSSPASLKLLLPKKTSVDEDSENEGTLMIDEKMLKKSSAAKNPTPIPSRGSLKIRLSGTLSPYVICYFEPSPIYTCFCCCCCGWNFQIVGGRSDFQLAETTEVGAHMDIETGDDNSTAKNGIEHLIRASSITGSEALEDLEYADFFNKKYIRQCSWIDCDQW